MVYCFVERIDNMKTSSIEVLKTIPDFDDFIKLSQDIGNLSYKKLSLESEIKYKESQVFKVATTTDAFLIDGKKPSTTAIDNTYKHSGIDGEILPLRAELAEVVSQLEQKRIQLDIYKSMIEVWRTLSSNERASLV